MTGPECDKLLAVMDAGKIQTPGQVAGLLHRIKYLTRQDKKKFWRTLYRTLPHEVYVSLKDLYHRIAGGER